MHKWNSYTASVLHRHPGFTASRVDDLLRDCCGDCPLPTAEEEPEHREILGYYVDGPLTFLGEDPCSRQTVGSFHPLNPDDYSEQAYVNYRTFHRLS